MSLRHRNHCKSINGVSLVGHECAPLPKYVPTRASPISDLGVRIWAFEDSFRLPCPYIRFWYYIIDLGRLAFPSFHIHFVRVSLLIYYIGRPSLQGNIQLLFAVPQLAHYFNTWHRTFSISSFHTLNLVASLVYCSRITLPHVALTQISCLP